MCAIAWSTWATTGGSISGAWCSTDTSASRYCDVRLGVSRLGVQAMENAISRDPGNWEYHYGLALVRGAAGLDPRPAVRRALELNPRSGMVIRAVRRFTEAEGPREWRQVALQASLPVD
jgi:hypothetical protein